MRLPHVVYAQFVLYSFYPLHVITLQMLTVPPDVLYETYLAVVLYSSQAVPVLQFVML